MTNTREGSGHPIFLATDFGPGFYVGVMKAVIAGIAPGVPVIDLTHHISPQDIAEGIWHLRVALPYLPADAIVVAVVDPGVGTARRALCVLTDRGQLAVGPDNGILSFIPPEKRVSVFAIENAKYTLPNPSAVFHGRDIFAPVAAHLSQDLIPSELGPMVKDMVELSWPATETAKDGVKGQVLAVDRFGNLLTNLEVSSLPAGGNVTVGPTRIGPIRKTYAEGEEDMAMALIGSSGFLEIAVRNGSAARKLRVGKDTTVFVREPR